MNPQFSTIFAGVRVAAMVGVSAFVIGAAGRPAEAAAAKADAFAENVWSNADFLDESSRLALTHSTSRRIAEFARRQAAEETAAANAVVAWTESNTADDGALATGRSVGKDDGSLVAVPLRAAETMTSTMADGFDGLMSGRSVAIDGMAEPTVPARPVPHASPTLKPNAAANLAALKGLRGRAFDTLYKSAQRDSLLQLSTIYAAYIQNGGDAGLRSLSVRELAKVDGMLAELRRL